MSYYDYDQAFNQRDGRNTGSPTCPPFLRRTWATRRTSIRFPSHGAALTLLSVAFHTVLPKTDFFDNDYLHSGEKTAEALLAYTAAYWTSKILFSLFASCLGKAFCKSKTIRESLPKRSQADDNETCTHFIELSAIMWRGMTYLFSIPTMLNQMAIRLNTPSFEETSGPLMQNLIPNNREENPKKHREDPVLCNEDLTCKTQTLFTLSALLCFAIAGGTAYTYTHFYLENMQTFLQDEINLNESWSEDTALALIPTTAVAAYFATKAIIALTTAACIMRYCNTYIPDREHQSFGYGLHHSPLAGTNLKETELHQEANDAISLTHMPSVPRPSFDGTMDIVHIF